jgi:replicative DNA helicase Mcm
MELLDTKTLVKKFHSFFEDVMRNEIRKIIHEGKTSLDISFFDISEYDIELGDQLLAFPEDVVKIMENTVKSFLEKDDEEKSIKVRLISLPTTERVMIRNIRSEHLGKLVLLEGLVRRKTDVRPRLTTLEYLCTNPSCSYSENKLRIQQLEDKTKTIKSCPKCKSQVELVNKVLVDSQNLVLEEIPEQLENPSDQPKRINVLLQEDLVSPFKDSKTNPGSKVIVIGIVREIPITTRTGAESINYDLVVEGNHIELSSEDYSEIIISKEEENNIKELSKDSEVIEKLVSSTAPSIYGYNKIKEAILLQQFGGAGGTKGDGATTRADIHILLIGDPGAAKSQMLKAATRIAPKSMFVSGKSASAAGLTASVMKDDLTKGWALEAGALVLANGGLCAIDEMDKMGDEDTSAMHEALEQQCYHYDFELQFADGSSEKIGDYVEKYFKENKTKIIPGIDCEILDINTKELLTTDFNRITSIIPKKISRHLAPEEYYKISYSNGRSITVTPEHPVFIYQGNEIKEVSAALIKEGMLAPMPRHTKIDGKVQNLEPIKLNSRNKEILFPKNLELKFAYFLGFYGAEGHNYKNLKTRNYEIGISNTNEDLIDDIIIELVDLFKISIFKDIKLKEKRKKATKNLFSARIISKPFYQFFELNFPEFIKKAPEKRIPQKIKMSKTEIKEKFLQGYFMGDGFFDSERCGFTTSSVKMAEDMQDLLLNLEIISYIATENRGFSKYYKIVISGEENLEKFEKIITKSNLGISKNYDLEKINKIKEFLSRSRKKLNSRDTIPYEFLIPFNSFLKKCHVSDGTFTTLISRKQNSHRKLVLKYLEKSKTKIGENKELKSIAKEYEKFLKSDIKFIKIKKVEKIKDKKHKWV